MLCSNTTDIRTFQQIEQNDKQNTKSLQNVSTAGPGHVQMNLTLSLVRDSGESHTKSSMPSFTGMFNLSTNIKSLLLLYQHAKTGSYMFL